eukprot:7939829-Heterocapsa_arctica.AAC.1
MEDEEQRKHLKRQLRPPGMEEDESRPKLRRATRLAEKRRRDERADEEQEEEEPAVCGTISLAAKDKFWGCVLDGMKVDMKGEKEIANVRQEVGPPWHDDLTGQVLNTQK